MRKFGLAILLFAASPPAWAQTGEACLSASIGLIDFKAGHCFETNETEALWTARIEGRGGQPVTATFGKTEAGEPKTIATCSDMRELDTESLDALAVAREPDLLSIRRACDAVAYFGVGQPSETSYLREPYVDLAELAQVSVTALPDGMSLPEGWNGGETLAEAQRAGKLKILQISDAALAFEYGGKRYALNEVGRADFSNDGLEDMLVMVDEVLRTGERRHSYALGLTRLEVGRLLTRVDQNSE